MEDVEKFFVQRRGWPREIIDKLIDEALLLLPAELSESAPRAEVVNLSEAGAGVLTPMPLKKGTHVKLQIWGKDIPTLEFEAEVRWAATSPVSTGKYPTGLKFLRLDEQGRSSLQEFIHTMRKYRPPFEQSYPD
ncbi:MAG: PilZ domain-containing protein [Candidatus Hydrogenedentota bacterium]|nr:MAG: PilZ domain-containing protein [Candidatus Hydrogenedentota bacterium]